MARKRYEADYILNLNKTISSLQNAKKEAEAFDDIMSSIGKRGNFNELVKYFVGLDDAVDNLRQSTNELTSELGDSLKGGYIKSLDAVFDKLAQISKMSGSLFSNMGSFDLEGSDAPKKLENMAKQLNEVFDSFGIKGKINLENFSTKPVEEQYKRLGQLIKTLNKDINTTIGGISVGNIQNELSGAFSGSVEDVSKVSKELAKQDKLVKNLTDSIKEYRNALQQREELRFGTKEYNAQQIKMDDLEVEMADLLGLDIDKDIGKFRELEQVIGDFVVEDIDAVEAGKQLTQIFGIDLSQAFSTVQSNIEPVIGDFKSITTEAKKTSNAVKEVMYHLGTGSALSKSNGGRDSFGMMLDNLTTNAQGTSYEKYGYGVLGSGIFGVQDPATIPTDQASSAGKFIYSLDLSKYNMYLVDTEERAASLMDFMSKLQKFSIKSALPSYTGFDEHLKDLDVDTLYDQATVLFDQSDLTKEKFKSFLNEMATILKQSGLYFDADEKALNFENISDDLYDSENISTRFFKMLGYEGVNVGHTSLDGFGQGSVLFDFNASDIVGYFNTIQDAEQDFHNLSQQGWVGSNEQLLQYSQNIDKIIARIQSVRQDKIDMGLSGDFIKRYDDTLALLDGVKHNIDDILSGKDVSGNSPFEAITIGADKANNTLKEEGSLLKEQIELEKQIDQQQALDSYDDEELDVIKRENGALEDRLEILRDIADEYGVQISQKDRNRYDELVDKDNEEGLTSKEADRFDELGDKIDEADSNLLEFEKTYKRIVLTLSNGKKLEILPDDKGLRDLYKISDEYGTYNGHEIEDVQFERVGQQLQSEIPAAAIKTETAIEDVSSKLKAFYGLLDEINSKDFYSSMDNVEIGKYTERLEVAKAELDSLGEQGLITANELEAVQTAFNDSKIHLELQTVGYTGYGIYNRSYADEYHQADQERRDLQTINDELKEKNRLLEEEAALKQEILDKTIAEKEVAESDLREETAISNELGQRALNAEWDLEKEKARADVLEQQNAELKEQLELEKQIAAIDKADDNDVPVIQKENAELKEQQQIVENIANADKLADNVQTPVASVDHDGSYALESTLQQTNSILTSIEGKLSTQETKSTQPIKPFDVASINTAVLDAASGFGSELQIGGLTTLKNGLVQVQGAFKNAEGVWEGFTAQVNETNQVVKIGTNNQSAFAKALNDASAETQAATNQQQKSKAVYGSTQVVNAQAKYNQLSGKAQGYIDNGSLVARAALDQYTNALNNLIAKQKEFNSIQDINSDEANQAKIEFKELQDACNQYANALKNIIASSEKFSQNGENKQLVDAGFDFSDQSERESALRQYVETVYQGTATIGNFNEASTELNFTLKNSDGTVRQMTAAFDASQTVIASTGKTAKQAKSWFGSLFDEITHKSRGLLTYFTARFGIDELFQQVRKGIQYVREIDAAMTELKKVTDETDATYNQFLQTASKSAGAIGSTVKDFTTVTSDFARLGYGIEDASKLAEVALVYENVGDGFSSVDEASESIISTMKAFGTEANDAMSIVDKFNAVGNRFAITSKGIGDALQRSASALHEAGNSIDESIALITAANSVVQDPEQVGTALKTLSLRLRGAKVDLEEAGLETDGMASSVSTLREKLLALTGGEVDIMIDENNFKNTAQILEDMSRVWDKMTDVNQAAALELMGGKRQANILSSIISNYETVEKVIDTSMNSSGSAIAENQKYMESIQGHIDQFNNSVQTFWMNLIDSDAIKALVDFGKEFFDFLDTGHGKIITLVGALSMLAKFKGTSLLGIGSSLVSGTKAITKVSSVLQAMRSTLNPATIGLDPTSINAYAMAVSNLTAKQQANMLASAGLSKQQIQLAMQYNGLDDAVIKEATAHTVAANAKNQESMTDAALLTQKAQLLAASYREQAATLTGTAASTAAAAADFLEKNASEGVTLAKVQEAVASGKITAATGAEIIAKLGLTAANKGLNASIKALFMSNPIGWIINIISAVLTLIATIASLNEQVERMTEEIEQSLQSALDECKNIANEFKSLSKTANDVIPRFVELSEGVDRFGQNISLTDEEYEEFLDLNNQIAEMFPDINMGFDENGNAMLALAGTADTLRASLEDLIETERAVANIEISDKIPDVLKDLRELRSDYIEEQNFNKNILSVLKQGHITKGRGGLNKDEYNDIKEILEEYDIAYETTGTSRNRHSNTKTLHWDPNDPEILGLIAGYEKKIAKIERETDSLYKSLNSLFVSWMSTDFDYQQLDTDLQYAATTFVSNIDFQELGLKTEAQIQDYIRSHILFPLQDAAPEMKEAFSELFRITPNGQSTKEYVDTIKSSAQEIADLSNGTFTYDEVLKNSGYDNVIQQYEDYADDILKVLDDSIPKYYETLNAGTHGHFLALQEYDAQVQDLKDNIYSLTPDQMTKALSIVKQYGIKTWDELKEALEKKTFDVVVELDVEQEGLDKLSTAIEESASASGLSSESIANLKSRYQDLEGYDPARLFEETTHGIRLNTEALGELEKAYEEQNTEDLNEKLEGLVDHYNDLTLEIEDCSNAAERAQLYAQRDNVIDQINDTATLISQYEGLTSAYNKWQKAQSGPNDRDMYESLISGKKEMDEEMSRGWLDAGTREYLSMLSGQDLSFADYDEVLKIYEQLGKKIGNSGYSVYDFFTEDEDGNSTNEGIFNFFDTVMAKQKELGKEWVKINEEGEYVFDFGVDGDKAIADALGISEELVQIILKAAEDAGFEINLNSAYSSLADLKNEADKTNARLKELGATEYTFNVNSTSITDLNTQIEEAQKAIKNLYNEDGTLKVDVSEEDLQNAQTLLATLIYQKQTLDTSTVMKIDVEAPTTAVETFIQKMQEYQAAYNELEVKTALGVDTTEAEQAVEDAKKAMMDAASDAHIAFGADLNLSWNEDYATISEKIKQITPEMLVKVGLDSSKVDEYADTEKTTTGKVIWDNNIDKVTAWMAEAHTADGKVIWDNDATKVATAFTAKGTITWSSDGVSVNGTAHSSGTAYKSGSWGAPKTETSLVGELGPEMRVRDGRWELVGQNGAEFTDVKKGDIIFNHKQTEDLLSHGYVIGRGKAYAIGTAFSGGTGPTRGTAGPIGSNGQGPGESTVSGAANKVSDAADDAKDMIDFIEIKVEEIEHEIAHATAKIENYVDDTSKASQKSKQYDKLVGHEKEKKATYEDAESYYLNEAEKLLGQINSQYRTMAQNGAIAIEDFVGDDETKQAELIQEYRDMISKANSAEVAALESIARIEELRLEQFNDLADDYDNRISLIEAESDLIDSQMDLQEESGKRLSSKYYEELIKNTNETINELTNKRDQMVSDLNAAVSSGDIKKGSDAWYEMVNAISEVDAEIIECQISIEEFQNAINDLKWDNFDKLIDRFDNLDSELSHLYDRFTDTEDVADKDGVWSDESIAALGVAAQQMELAQQKAQQYAQAINDLNKDYKAGKYSPDEYNEKLAELTEGQWDSIEAYEDAKDSIMDLNEARIDAIKDGIEEEIDAYKELIDAKKEALDADKDLYDFEKNVKEQQKDIAAIERKIAALSGDTSISATAQRKKLEAELLEAKAELEDTYYDRSIENQKNALDAEYEYFEDSKNEEMEALDESLKNQEAIIAESLNTVKANADVVLKEINDIASQYGITISDSIVSPWKDGGDAISAYKTQFTDLTSTFTEELEKIIEQEKELAESLEDVTYYLERIVELNKQRRLLGPADTTPDTPDTPAPPSNPDQDPIKPGQTVTVDKNATHFATDGGNGTKMQAWVPGSSFIVIKIDGDKVLIGDGNGIPTGWVKKSDLEGYAKGTTGVKNDQWAWIDEIGEELVLHAGENGKLAYLSKGTSVIPSNLTNKLMDLALDPTTTLENSKPVINAPHIVNNEINIDMSFGSVVNIEHVDNDTIPDLTKAVEKQMDKYMKGLNNQIRKYSR